MDSVGGTANKVSSLIAGCWRHLGVYWRFIRNLRELGMGRF